MLVEGCNNIRNNEGLKNQTNCCSRAKSDLDSCGRTCGDFCSSIGNWLQSCWESLNCCSKSYVSLEEKELTPLITRSEHTASLFEWPTETPNKVKLESSLKNKAKLMASCYKCLLYKDIKTGPYCGGWYLLSHQNYVNNGHEKFATPEELGLNRILPDNWEEYRSNIIRYMRDGALVVRKCKMEKRGEKPTIGLQVTNTTREEISFEVNRGQIFEQTQVGIGKIPHLVVWDYLDEDNKEEGFKITKKGENLVFTIEANKTIEVILDVRYLNKWDTKIEEGTELKLHVTDFELKAAKKVRGEQSKIFSQQSKYTKEEYINRIPELKNP